MCVRASLRPCAGTRECVLCFFACVWASWRVRVGAAMLPLSMLRSLELRAVAALRDARRKVDAVASLQGDHVNRRKKVGLAWSHCLIWLEVGSEDRAAYVYDLNLASPGACLSPFVSKQPADPTSPPGVQPPL